MLSASKRPTRRRADRCEEQQLFADLPDRDGSRCAHGGEDLTETLIDSLVALQPAIDRAQATFAPMFEDFAPAVWPRKTWSTRSPAARATARPIPSRSACSWKCSGSTARRSMPTSSSTALRVLDKKPRAFILMKGLDRRRPLRTARPDESLHRFGSAENILVLDAEKLDLSGIDPSSGATSCH